jgi:3-hydroxybutyryl-CoA dehydrogenase
MSPTAPLRTIGVVGCGLMGAGIAQVAAQGGYTVRVREVDEATLNKGLGRIGQLLARAVEKGKATASERERILANLAGTTSLRDLADCDLVIEAIVEDLDAKKALFRELEAVVGPVAVLATNTSALSVAEIARAVERPERVVGMHFLNPAPVLPLVEVVRTELSSEAAVETAFALAERVGKEPIRCGDTPGFVVNRILIPLLNDCVRVLDEAGVTPEDLDKAMTRGVSWPIGPCALLDLIGLDVHVHASEALFEAVGEERMAPPERLVRMRDEGLLGRKSGRGFFHYEG